MANEPELVVVVKKTHRGPCPTHRQRDQYGYKARNGDGWVTEKEELVQSSEQDGQNDTLVTRTVSKV